MRVSGLDIADMCESGEITGKTLELVYKTGPNKDYPVYMQFTGFHINNHNKFIDYILTNPNVPDYRYPTPTNYLLTEFVQSFIDRSDYEVGAELDYMRFTCEEVSWEL